MGEAPGIGMNSGGGVANPAPTGGRVDTRSVYRTKFYRSGMRVLAGQRLASTRPKLFREEPSGFS